MRFFSSLNIYYRLLVLILGTTSFFFILYFCLYFYTIRQEKAVYKSALKEYNNEVNSIFELNSKTHAAAIVDVTFWDEMVDYLSTKDNSWYEEYIESQFISYQVDFIGIYDLKNQRINQTISSKLKSIGPIPDQVLTKLYKSKFIKFYSRLPQGIVEIFGATIHPSDDPFKNKSKPSGYFIMARLMDEKFVTNLEKITSSKISIVPNNLKDQKDKTEIVVNINLKDWKNETVGDIRFERAFHLNFSNTKNILGIIIIATIVNLLIYLYYYRKWVNKPLMLIKSILENKDEQAMTTLRKLRGDLGYIGALLEDNNNNRKQLEIAKQKAEEGDKLKSSFLANLSHEIRTPMNAIMGFSDLLSETDLSEGDKIHYLKIIRESGKNLTSIIEDLLEMSKIDSKQITPNYKGVDLDQCILELHQSIKITIAEENEIDFSIQESLEKPENKILTDETKLKQILTNLITNAVKFTKKGKVIVGYEIDKKNNNIELWVQDTGLGIAEHNIKIIFDRFRRIEDDFSIKLSGLGLGLSITKAYVELLGGTIKVKSAIGVGSVFSFTIPLTYAKPESLITEKISNNKSTLPGNKTILVAEDNDFNFLLLEKVLKLKDYKVIRATNGKEAVDICTSNNDIDLVFMDLKMPVMDGFEALRAIKAFNQHLPIVAYTAYSSAEDKEKISTAGFNGYVSKPINKKDLYELLDLILNSK